MREIICTNGIYSLSFGTSGFNPFFLASVDGIYKTENDLQITKNAMSDGGTFQGSTAKVRNIVLTVMTPPRDEYRLSYRDYLYTLFSKDSHGKLTVVENGSSRYINYRVESVEMSAWKERTYNISLLCEDPFFHDENVVSIDMASWNAGFEFIHEFTAIQRNSQGQYVSGGEEFAYREAKDIVEINNKTNKEGIGLIIRIRCMGDVVNPVIINVDTQEHIAIGTSNNALNLIYGDIVEVSTGTNKKHVKLIRDNVETNINQYISEDTVFLQLDRGVTAIGYSADSGREHMEINISYLPTYEGA